MKRRFGPTAANLILFGALFLGLFLCPGRGELSLAASLAVFGLAALAGESLRHTSPDGRSVSMAAAAQIPILALVPAPWSIGLVVLTGYAGARLWRRATVPAAGVHAAGLLVAATVVGLGLRVAAPGATAGALHEPSPWRSLMLLPASGVVFLLLVQAADAAWTARTLGAGAVRTWRATYGAGSEGLTSGALVLVGVLAVLCFESMGLRGVLLCVMPLLFVRDASRRYLDLKNAQARIVEMERLVAKGEMAAEIGHELNNYLSAVSGRAQLLEMSLEGRDDEETAAMAERLRRLSTTMAMLARGLMDFSHRETKRTRVEMGDLVARTVELVRPQARFRGVTFEVDAAPGLPAVEMDPGQIQQAILTLLRRAAGPGGAGDPRALRIVTATDDRRKEVSLEIHAAASPPPSAAKPPRAAEDPDLGKVLRIVERHHGRFRARDESADAGYRIVLPAA